MVAVDLVHEEKKMLNEGSTFYNKSLLLPVVESVTERHADVLSKKILYNDWRCSFFPAW